MQADSDNISGDDDTIAFFLPQFGKRKRPGSIFKPVDLNTPPKTAPHSKESTTSPIPTSPTEREATPGRRGAAEESRLRTLQDLTKGVRSPATLSLCADILREHFHIASGQFRANQAELCLSILAGRNTLGVCPTGWGKSLTYQFPMVVHRLLFNELWKDAQEAKSSVRDGFCVPDDRQTPQSKCCLVVSPLLALMADQAHKVIQIQNLRAEALLTKEKEARVLAKLREPCCDIDIVYVSPERLVSSTGLRTWLAEERERIPFVCLDEVHCVSKWSYDFRPSFLYIDAVIRHATAPGLQEKHNESATSQTVRRSLPYLCLTATASDAVVADLKRQFQIENAVVSTEQHRLNLKLESLNMCPCGSGPPTTHEILSQLLRAVEELPHPMLIYVRSRADADEISSYIASKMGARRSGNNNNTEEARTKVFEATHYPPSAISSEAEQCHPCAELQRQAKNLPQSSKSSPSLVVRSYHAALSTQQRSATQKQFLCGKVDVLVATIAFGMGIDKPDLRSVVHAYVPDSLEGYVQEIGRAGRDGRHAVCRLLYNPYDFFSCRTRLYGSLLSLAEVRSVVERLLCNPVAMVGEPLMMVSLSDVSKQLEIPEEAVETLFFMLLTDDSLADSVLSRLLGNGLMGFRASVSATTSSLDDVSAARLSSRRSEAQSWGTHDVRGRRPKRSKKGTALTGCGGIGDILAQMGTTDVVLTYLTRHPVVANRIAAANELHMSVAEFDERLQDLESSGAITLDARRYGHCLHCSPTIAASLTAASLDRIACAVHEVHHRKVMEKVRSLNKTFAVLAAPTHQSLQLSLSAPVPSESEVQSTLPSWSPPPRTVSRADAVSIANDFVETNRLRINSTTEAARALAGVRPKSVIQHGKYAGQLPLSCWYVKSPLFGALHEFDMAWIESILRVHQLDPA